MKGKNGYKISYEASIPDGARVIIIAMHGFCGDKSSSCIGELEKRVTQKGIGLIKFDWPGHGESEAAGDQLTLDNCLSDIDSVVEYVKSVSPHARLIAFATSFGGYLALLYNYYNRDVFEKIILRSPAINMYKALMNGVLTNEALSQLRQNGSTVYGFERDLKITESFVEEVRGNDISEMYHGIALPNVSIIHGTDDDLVPFADSRLFANEHRCQLHEVKGADHRYKKPGELDKVIEITMKILEENGQ